MKKFVSFSLALLILLSLASCGEDTVESVIEDSLDFVEDVDSVHCATVTGMDITVGENKMTNALAMDADLDVKNRCSHIAMLSDSNGEELAVEFYVDSSKSPAEYFIGSGEKWVKMDPSNIANVDVSADLTRDFSVYFDEFLSNAQTTMQVEDVDGEQCFKLHAPVTISSYEMAKNFSVDGFITGFLGEDASQDMIDTVISALGPIQVTVYIRCEDYSPFGFVIDIQSALETLYRKLEISDAVIGEAYASSVYTDYDEADVEIPEKVRFAPNMSSVTGG